VDQFIYISNMKELLSFTKRVSSVMNSKQFEGIGLESF